MVWGNTLVGDHTDVSSSFAKNTKVQLAMTYVLDRTCHEKLHVHIVPAEVEIHGFCLLI